MPYDPKRKTYIIAGVSVYLLSLTDPRTVMGMKWNFD
jgi:hypothetical protein